MFFDISLFCLSKLHLFEQIYSKSSIIVKYYYHNCFLFEYMLKKYKAVFSASSLQSSVSHDPSEIILICWFAAQETLLSMLKKTNWDSLNRNLYEVEMYSMNVFTVTFDQFNASLLNKSINFFPKEKSYWPQTFEQYLLQNLYISDKCCSF